MRKITGIVVLLLAAAAVAGAVDIFEEELFSVKRGSVEFLNYEGPHTKVETREQIMGIGRSLGTLDTTISSTSGYAGKYSILHITDDEDPEGLNADVVILHPDAEVDHIRNVRLIVSGYIMQAYGYTFDDAYLVAEFVTFYNAVFRGNMEYFRNTYKSAVLAALDPEKAGISTRYTEWPGKTQMLIPLTSSAAEKGLGSLHTDELTGDEVIQDLRQQEGMGIEERKEMTELKEREVEQEQAKIQQEKEELDQKAGELDTAIQQKEEEEQAIQEAVSRVEEQEAAAQQEKTELAAKADKTPEEEQRRQELEQETQALKEEKEQLESRQEASASERAGLEAEREQVTQEQEELAQEEQQQAERQERIGEEREQIARDEQGIIEEENAQAAVAETPAEMRTAVFLVTREENGTIYGRLAKVNVRSGDIVGSSGVRTIRGRRVYDFADSVLVVAGIKEGDKAVRLMLLDPDTFAANGVEGDADVYPETDVLIKENAAFAVIESDGSYRIGRFGEGLSVEAISDAEVSPYSAITDTGQGIMAQDAGGVILILDYENLRK